MSLMISISSVYPAGLMRSIKRSWACVPPEAHGHRGRGGPYAMTGRREQARAHLSATIALDSAMETRF
jgi:hypothetical protein